MDYTLVFRADSDGHHIYECDDDGRLVIADHRADDQFGWPDGPEATDDGPLFVDFDRPVSRLETGNAYLAPARKKNGEWVSFVGKLDEVHRLEKLAGRRFGS